MVLFFVKRVCAGKKMPSKNKKMAQKVNTVISHCDRCGLMRPLEMARTRK